MSAEANISVVHGLSSACFLSDSPGVPPSAGAHQLFRGFSFVDTAMLEEDSKQENTKPPPHPVVQVSHLSCRKPSLKLQVVPLFALINMGFSYISFFVLMLFLAVLTPERTFIVLVIGKHVQTLFFMLV